MPWHLSDWVAVPEEDRQHRCSHIALVLPGNRF